MHSLVDVIIAAGNDASASSRCASALRDAGGDLLGEIIEIGASASPAQAIARHAERDVVILDARAEVAQGWLGRLAACAWRESSVATVSPFSSEGPIASYPCDRAAGASVRDLDALFARENAAAAIEIPCAVPFCAYITRRALLESGGLESLEPAAIVDFCARATGAGLHHLLCADVFVGLAGAADQMIQRFRESLESHADLAEDWRDFLRREPARPLRRRVDLARLRASSRPRILFVTHRWGGGVERHVNDLAELLADDCEVVVLRPDVGNTIHLRWLRAGEELEAWFDAATEWPACRDLLRSMGIARVHFHHVHGLPRESLSLPGDLNVPYDLTLHDHFPICPQYHLADAEGRYCGEPDAAGCAACLQKRPAQWPLDIVGWRALFHGVLREASRVIAPSADLGARVQKYFPDVQPMVWPHPEMHAVAPRIHKVLLLGGLSAIKGVDLFEACARDAAARGLPLHFRVLGHLSRPLDLAPDAPVSISGTYRDSRLAELVELERPDAFLFLSQVPESYSYTLSAAMRGERPIVATNIGAFVERLRTCPCAALVAPDAPASVFNDTLLRLLRSPVTVAAARPLAVPAE